MHTVRCITSRWNFYYLQSIQNLDTKRSQTLATQNLGFEIHFKEDCALKILKMNFLRIAEFYKLILWQRETC